MNGNNTPGAPQNDAVRAEDDRECTLGSLTSYTLDGVVSHMKRIELFFKDRLDIDIYLTWGTLLGAVRSNDFISFDVDVDLAYFSPMMTDHEIVEEHNVIRHVLFRNDMIVTLNSKGQIHIAAEVGSTLNQKDTTSLDLWTTWVRDQRYFHYPDIQGDLSADMLLPLRRVNLRGTEFWAPNKSELVLEEFYGPDWRVPDPNYAWYPRRDQGDPFEFLRHEIRDVKLPAQPRCVAGLTREEDGDIFIVRAPGATKPVRLNSTAVLILEFCNGRQSVANIIELVHRAYEMDSSPTVVVHQFLTEALDEGLIE